MTRTTYTSHTYTNNCDGFCNVCSEVRTPPHTYSGSCDRTCNGCSTTRTTYASHTYADNCDNTCNVCSEVRIPPHTYSGNCDAICNDCSATRTTPTAHIYQTTTNKATTSKDGSIVKKCSVCGSVSTTPIKYAKTFTLSTTDYSYNGKTKTPTVTVCDSSGKVLKKNTDYRVSYASGRKKVGKYKVKVTLKGNYSGTKTLYFQIKPTIKTKINLLVGATTKIGAKSNKKITYSSSNKKVVKVSSSGVLTAVKKGTANVTVKSNGISQKIKVKVEKPYVKISGSKTMNLGDSVKFTANTNCKAKVKWSSSNTKVATVSSSGKVTAKKAGSATIYAKITYKGKTYKASYKITVVKKSNYQILKEYILKYGYTDSNGNKTIGFNHKVDNTVYITTISYDSKKGCLIFKETCDYLIYTAMSFEYKENQKFIDVKMIIEGNSTTKATIDYTLEVSRYNNTSSFYYYIQTVGVLSPSDYKGVISTFNDIGFCGWQLLLLAEVKLSLRDIGFINY